MLLAACGSETSGEFTTEDGQNAEYTIDKDSGETSMTIKGPDGTATLRSGAEVPVSLPDGFSLYPGAKVVSTMNSNSDGNKGAMVVMESSAKPDAVIAWYRKSVEGKGFKVETEITTGDMRAIAGAKDGGSFTLQVAPADAGSSITLIAGAG